MSKYPSARSLTLIELLIAVSLLAVMVLGIANIDIFSRFQLVTADRRVKLQNDLSLCLEHMVKNLSNAIGNEALLGANSSVFIWPNSTNTAVLSVFTDTNGNGTMEAGAGDYWMGYIFNSGNKQLNYCSRCADYSCSSCSVAQELLAKDITAFSASKDFSQGNYINVVLTACWDPTGAIGPCGSPSNPSATMATAITLPSVSNR